MPEFGKAIRELREAYGETQKAFSRRARVPLRSLARYETGAPIKLNYLSHFILLAKEIDRFDLVDLFMRAFAPDTEARELQESRPADIEEMIWTSALLDIMRNGLSVFSSGVTLLPEIQTKIVQALRMIAKEPRAANESPGANESLRRHLQLCEEQLGRRELDRAMLRRLMRLEECYGLEPPRVFETFWGDAFSDPLRDLSAIAPEFENLTDQAVLDAPSRNMGAIAAALDRLGQIFADEPLRYRTWAEYRAAFEAFFEIDESQEKQK